MMMWHNKGRCKMMGTSSSNTVKSWEKYLMSCESDRDTIKSFYINSQKEEYLFLSIKRKFKS